MAVSGTSANSIYGAISAKNKGIGGLASGLDTESLVEALTMATRSKISKQQQSRQTLLWKQTAYRGAATTLGAFKSSYLDILSPKNMTSPTTFNVYKATPSNDAVSVKATSTATTGNISIEQVNQLATNAKIDSQKFASQLEGTDIDFTAGNSFTGKTITLRMDSNAASERVIKLDTLNGKTSQAAIQTELESLINKAYGSSTVSTGVITPNVTAGANAGEFKIGFTSNANRLTVIAGGDALGLKIGDSNRISTSTTLKDFLGANLVGTGAEGKDLSFTINGVVINATIDESLSSVMTKINNSSANVKMTFDALSEKFNITAQKTGSGATLALSDTTGNFLSQVFGLKGSSVLSSGSLSSQLKFGSVDGDILVDGVEAGSAKDKLDKLILLGGPASINVSVNGVSKDIAVTYTSTDLAAAEKAIVAAAKTKYATKYPAITWASSTLTIADVKAGITGLADSADDLIEFDKAIDLGYRSAFGGAVESAYQTQFGDKSGVRFYIGTDGTIGFDAALNANMQVEVKATAGATGQANLFETMGFGTGNEVKRNYDSATLADVGLAAATSGTLTIKALDNSSKTVTYTENTTIYKLMTDINEAYGGQLASIDRTGKLVLDAGDEKLDISDSAGDTGILKKLYGVSSYVTPDAVGGAVFTEGKNAIITVKIGNDKTQMISTSNTFNIQGVEITANKLFGVDPADPLNSDSLNVPADQKAGISISVVADQTSLVDTIKEFVKDYNTMVTALTTAIGEEKVSGYDPLTDEQRAEMTEDQIKAWEKEAKKGLLRSDSTLRNIVSKLRATFYEKVESAGLSPFDIGLETTSIYSSGTLDMKKDGMITLNEDKLNKSLELNADSVRSLFTDQEEGLAIKLNKVIDSAIDPRSDPKVRGSLIVLAGTAAITGDNSSVIGNKIKDIDKFISTLKTRLEAEHSRYWKKFSALESAISRMSAQSSWLSEQ